MKRKISILAIVFLLQIGTTINSIAQIKEIGSFMAAGPSDAEKLLEAYISPLINGFGASMTGGWYNTAKTHKSGGFDLTITGNIAFIPTEFKTFKVDELKLSTLHLDNTSKNLSPTIAGKKEDGPQLNYNIPGNIKAFDLPQGTNVAFVPTPMAQLSIGLFKDTEITGRYMPKVKLGSEYDISLWGIGLKHGIKQWIPAIKKIPFFNLTLQGGYTQLTINTGLHVTPEIIGLGSYNSLPESTWNDQNMKLEISSLTANLLISADIPFVSFYGGVGFVTTKSQLIMQGVYPMLALKGTVPNVIASEKDPIDFQIKDQDGGVTKPRLNIGARFKFGFFTLHFDYTRANYNVATAGIGICFR
jgi:hypothetical protein